MISKTLVLMSLLLLLLPFQIQQGPSAPITETFVSYEYNSKTAEIILQSGQRMAAGQVLVTPVGFGPKLDDNMDVISMNMSHAHWQGCTLNLTDIRNETMQEWDPQSALTVMVYHNEEQIMSAVLGIGDSDSVVVGKYVTVGEQTVLALSADRDIPTPLVPIPLDIFLEVHLILAFEWVFTWEVTYEINADSPFPGDIWVPPISIETGLIIAGLCGLICVAWREKQK